MAYSKTVTAERPPFFIALRDADLNSNNKALDYNAVIGKGNLLRVHSVEIKWVATATAGTRTPVIEIEQEGNVVRTVLIAATVTASQTKTITAARDLDPTIANQESLGELVLGAGQILRVRDTANIDANDDPEINVLGVVE